MHVKKDEAVRFMKKKIKKKYRKGDFSQQTAKLEEYYLIGMI